MNTTQTFVTMILTVLASLLMIETGYGQVVPYKTFGSDAFYMPEPDFSGGVYGGSGNGTHVGRHEFAGAILLTSATTFAGAQTLTAADGSQIFMTVEGTVELIPLGGTMFTALWSGGFTVVGGNGRFENIQPAAEPLSLTAMNEPFDIVNDEVWLFSWRVRGKVDLGNR